MAKFCCTCKIYKEAEEFGKNAAMADGLTTECKACRSIRRKLFYSENKEMENRRNAMWDSRNRGKKCAHTAAYKAAKSHRTPSWADLDEINKIYEEAAKRRQNGENVVVDHVIPLRATLASGLHVHNNLQIITQRENDSKRNKFEVM